MVREGYKCDTLFQNELNLYEKILPFLLDYREPLENDVNAISFVTVFLWS